MSFYNLSGLSYRCDNRWFIGGIFASKIHTATIGLVMIVAFILMILLLVGKLLEILPIGGSSFKLNGYKLILGFIGIFVAGFLVCFGVGLFALVQAILFYLECLL